eukprot:scaffold12962_cov135-Isochrysis_galbana.AAC.3
MLARNIGLRRVVPDSDVAFARTAHRVLVRARKPEVIHTSCFRTSTTAGRSPGLHGGPMHRQASPPEHAVWNRLFRRGPEHSTCERQQRRRAQWHCLLQRRAAHVFLVSAVVVVPIVAPERAQQGLVRSNRAGLGEATYQLQSSRMLFGRYEVPSNVP